MNNLFKRISLGLRLIFPSPARYRYERIVRSKHLFDRAFYLGVNQKMHWVSKLFPLRHYILLGEQMGLQPNPEFLPSAYLFLNADIAQAGIPPLLHYATIGQEEGRLTREISAVSSSSDLATLPIVRPDAGPEKSAPYAIYVHVFYADLWPEFANVIRQQKFNFDLFVTCTTGEDHDDTIIDQVKKDFPDAIVYGMPNHGRDIFPFIHMVNSGVFHPYKAVCKLHTKKSPHRSDGDKWRRHLIGGILGAPEQTKDRLEKFVKNKSAAFWVADGQFYDDTCWWGSNKPQVTELLQRLECRIDPENLSFPAGSIYWIKPTILEMLKGLQLTYQDFQPEHGQVDGTTAHAIERALGYITKIADQTVVQTSELDSDFPMDEAERPTFTSAFYLPQFHPTPENDRWWGKGFTEWRGVVGARPVYHAHVQPTLPSDLGFYDLRVLEVMQDQAQLAKDTGIDAFCIYHYWFDGRRILEKPIDNLLANPDTEFPFYLCWANESWRRNWDGLSGEVLLDQTYKKGFAKKLALDMIPYFNDARYQRPDGVRPRFVIYRPEDMPDPTAAVKEMRATWRKAGVGEVELGAVRFHIEGDHPVADDLFDFWVEMPPHGLVTRDDYLVGGEKGNILGQELTPGFRGLIYDYRALAKTSISTRYIKQLPKNTIVGIMPGWDNTARRGLRAHIAYGASPAAFARWLRVLMEKRLPNSYRNELFVNAWNEWAEKAILEPSQQYSDAYLRRLSDEIISPKDQS